MKRFFSLPMGLALVAASAIFAAGCNPPADKTTTDAGGKTDSGSTATNTGGRALPTVDGNSDSGSGKIKLGLIASLNGDLKPWGDDCLKGAELAVKEFNAAGGLNGREIELLVEDSASKPEQGKSAAEKLISDGALALVGEVASGITEQISQSAFEKGVGVVAVGATRTDITATRGNTFRVCYIDDFQGPVMAQFAYDLGLRNVAVMTDNKQIYSQYLSKTFSEKFVELGGKISKEETYESGQTQFTSQLTAIKETQPDGLFLSGYFNEVGPIIREASAMGIKGPYLGGDGWDSREIFTNAGDAIANGYFCNHYNNAENRPEVNEFLANWKKEYAGQEPATTMGALGYDAVKLALDAMKRASALNSKAIIEALENTEGFKAVSGEITLKGKGGNPPKRAIVVGLDPKTKTQTFKAAIEPK